METVVDKLSLLRGSHSCLALCFVVECNTVHRQLGSSFDRMISNTRTAFGHTELVTPVFFASMYTNETGYQRNCGGRFRFYQCQSHQSVPDTNAYQTPMLQSSELYISPRH
jgi:hypothetical protein